MHRDNSVQHFRPRPAVRDYRERQPSHQQGQTRDGRPRDEQPVRPRPHMKVARYHVPFVPGLPPVRQARQAKGPEKIDVTAPVSQRARDKSYWACRPHDQVAPYEHRAEAFGRNMPYHWDSTTVVNTESLVKRNFRARCKKEYDTREGRILKVPHFNKMGDRVIGWRGPVKAGMRPGGVAYANMQGRQAHEAIRRAGGSDWVDPRSGLDGV